MRIVPDPEVWSDRAKQEEALPLVLAALAEAGYPVDPETETRWCESCGTIEIRTGAPSEVMDRASRLVFDALGVPYEWLEDELVSGKHTLLADIDRLLRDS